MTIPIDTSKMTASFIAGFGSYESFAEWLLKFLRFNSTYVNSFESASSGLESLQPFLDLQPRVYSRTSKRWFLSSTNLLLPKSSDRVIHSTKPSEYDYVDPEEDGIPISLFTASANIDPRWWEHPTP